MIQIQQWYDAKRILVVDERHHGSVQVCIPAPDYEDSKLSGKADALIYALWVDEPYRRQGSARLMLEAAEHEAKKLGCKSVCLEWDNREAKEWTLHWYERVGYKEIEFGRHKSLLVKHL